MFPSLSRATIQKGGIQEPPAALAIAKPKVVP